MESILKQKLRIKYNRVSTLKQIGKRYKTGTEKYNLTLLDKVSGTVPFSERPKAQELIKSINSVSVSELAVEELSRLGRNTGDCIRTLKWLEEKEINVVVRNLNIQSRPGNEKNPIWLLIGSIMNSSYEFELKNIKERTMTGRMIYVQNNGKLGGPENSTESNKHFFG